MRTIVIGLGIQGKKRQIVSGDDFRFSIDPINMEATYRSLDEIDLKSFDSALLCLPDELKYEYVKNLTSNGKHVLIEKPFNISISETNEIKKIAKKNKSTVYVAYNHRFEPHWITTKELLRDKRIGDVYKLNLFYGNGTAQLVKNSTWRDKDLGVIPDLASHLFDLIDFWFGLENYKIDVVSANKYENKAYDNAVLKLIGKPEVLIEISLLSWRNSFKAEIVGSKGTISLDSLCKWGPSQLTIRNRKFPSGVPDEESFTLKCADPTWQYEYNHFKNLVLGHDFGNLDSNFKISQLFYELKQKI